jgi:threonine aldolase
MPSFQEIPVTDAELRLRCHTVLPGHRQQTPAELFSAMAAWCAQHDVAHDVYGDGELIQSFEAKIAALLGFDAGVFCITGTMTQVTALRVACLGKGNRLVALHPTAHIFKHERGNHQLLDHFQALQIGDPHRPWTLDDLKAIPDQLAAVVLEMPAREIGGQRPDWDELEAIKAYCRERGHPPAHGWRAPVGNRGRLWQAAARHLRRLRQRLCIAL